MSSAITDARYNGFYPAMSSHVCWAPAQVGWLDGIRYLSPLSIFNASVAVLVRGRDSEAAQQGAGRSCAH